jgi:hypothetical protein
MSGIWLGPELKPKVSASARIDAGLRLRVKGSLILGNFAVGSGTTLPRKCRFSTTLSLPLDEKDKERSHAQNGEVQCAALRFFLGCFGAMDLRLAPDFHFPQ